MKPTRSNAGQLLGTVEILLPQWNDRRVRIWGQAMRKRINIAIDEDNWQILDEMAAEVAEWIRQDRARHG